MLTQYDFHNEKTLCYIKHALYRLQNTNIAFEYYQSINSKLYKPTFKYLKFYTIKHFIQSI